jgi:thymidylate synthase
MQPFHDLLKRILTLGKIRPNRTGVDTKFVPGAVLEFDMADGFPAITTKKLAFKTAVGELLGFFRGYQSAAQFRELGCKVWDGNANETKDWLASPYRKGTDDLGRIYGAQWTDWRDWREVRTAAEKDALVAKGYEIRAFDSAQSVWILRRGINQLEVALRAIMESPTNRRIMITGWRPDEFDQMALPPCHVDYQFLCDVETKTLHLVFFQRSFDTALGFNVALGALMLSIFAKLSGYTAGTLKQFIGDAHIYVNHFEGVEELLSREHFAQPTLELGESIPTLTSVDQIAGIFTRIEPQDITLKGYESHPAIPFPMAA